MSKRRRGSPRSKSTDRPALPTRLERTADRHAERDPSASSPPLRDSHRLATSAGGRGGSVGSQPTACELLQAAAQLLRFPTVESAAPEVLRAAASEHRLQTKQAIGLERAAAELQIAEHESEVVRRRVERALASARRTAEREALRAAGGLYAGEPRSPNRPVHVEVEPAAWETVKAEAIRRRRAVGEVVAELLAAAADKPLPAQRTPQRTTSTGRRGQRFARLFLDDQTWSQFRARSTEGGITAARAIGIVVEHEATRFGWRPEAGQ